MQIGNSPPPAAHDEPRPHWLSHIGHLVDFGPLDPAIRWLGRIGGLLVLLPLLVLLLPLGQAAILPMHGYVRHLPIVVLVAGALMQALGWWYVLAGGALASAPLRWVTAVLFISVQLIGSIANPFAWFTIPATLAFAAITQWKRLRRELVIALAALLVAIFFWTALSMSRVLFAVYILTVSGYGYLAFVPMVFLTGVDIGESGIFLTRIALQALHPRLPAHRLFWVALGVMALKLMFFAVDAKPLGLGILTAVALIAAGGFAMHVSQSHGEPPEKLVLGFAFVVFVLSLGASVTHLVLYSIAVAAAALGCVLLALECTRRRTGAAAVFLLLFGCWLLLGPYGPTSAAQITGRALDEGVTLVALGYLVYLRVRGILRVERIMLVLFWVVGFTLVLGLLQVLYGLGGDSGAATALGVLFLVVGLGHEILASGGLINKDSRHLPRSARLFLYLGYLMLLSGATVLVQGTSGAMFHRTATDSIQYAGLAMLGIPLLLQQFLHAFHVGRHAAASTGNAPPR